MRIKEDEITKIVGLMDETDSTRYPILYYRLYRRLAKLIGLSSELPDHAVWEDVVTNGGKCRKNVKLPYKVIRVSESSRDLNG